MHPPAVCTSAASHHAAQSPCAPRYGDDCADFGCDSGGYRRKGGAAECVLDQCDKVSGLLLERGPLIHSPPPLSFTHTLLFLVLSSLLLQDLWSVSPDWVCIRNCTCPADGGSCLLDAADCSLKIDRRGGGGGGRHGVGTDALFFWLMVFLALGGAAAFGFIHFNGIPPWLPVRERGYQGMYNELSETTGI